MAPTPAEVARGGETRWAAGDRYATIGGGADVARQCLAAGLVDELQLHVVPVLLGDGIPLFAGSGPAARLTKLRVVDAPNVTHIRYRIGAWRSDSEVARRWLRGSTPGAGCVTGITKDARRPLLSGAARR
jgi:hypothetical protein